ncbi:MAG: hypothetical protein IT290_01400 [Deltaproteobacteria bacterium]|nr:hypothetical protein [Deltaproteobacteria bacterium]
MSINQRGVRTIRAHIAFATLVLFSPFPLGGGSASAQEAVAAESEPEVGAPEEQLAPTARESVDALQLLRRARIGVASAAKSLRDSKTDPKSKTVRPFSSALKRSYGDLRSVDKAISTRSAAPFFASLRKSSRDVAELSAIASAAGLSSSGYRQGIRLGRESVQFLRAGYGKEALRKRRDSVPSASEVSRFSAIKNEVAHFESSLTRLRAAAASKSDQATTRVVDAFSTRAASIQSAPATVTGFADVIVYLSVVEGSWKGASYYVNPAYVSAWKEADAALLRTLELLKDTSNWVEAVDWNDLASQIQIPLAASPRIEMTDVELLEIEKFIDSLEIVDAGNAISSAYDRSLSGLSGDGEFERLSDVTNRSGVADSTLLTPPPSGAGASSNATSDSESADSSSDPDPISAPRQNRPYDGPTSKDRPSGGGQPSTWTDPTGGSNGNRGSGGDNDSGDSGSTGSDTGGSSGGGGGMGGGGSGGDGGGGGSGDDSGVGDDGNKDRTDGRVSG